MDYDEVLNLCKDVIPRTWNAYKYRDTHNCRMEKGILNIELGVYDIPQNQNIKSQGCVESIRYWEGIAHTKINIYSIPILRSIVLLHELSHVAVFRLESFIIKSYYAKRKYFNNGNEIESDPHGKIFRSFLNIIEKRATKRGWTSGSTIFETKSVKIWKRPLGDESWRS